MLRIIIPPFFIVIFFSIIPVFSFAQEIELGQITIKKNSWKYSLSGLDHFLRQDLQNMPSCSPEEIIDYCSSVDLRKRSAFGIQQDVSLRGSNFEDPSINLQGVEINDPQTGHFSLEIPLTSADLEEVEILKNSQSINFTAKQPQSKGMLLQASWGQYALWEKLISFNFPLAKTKNRISCEHKISKGERQDTDFEIYNFSFHSLWEDENKAKKVEFLFGSTKKDFGADSFYSASYPHEEEHITQRFFSLLLGLKEESFRLKNILYLRRHGDKYVLDRHNPSFYTNYHTTYVYGLKTEVNLDNDLFFSFNIHRENIDSTNLNKRYRLKKGLALGVEEKRIGKFLFNFATGFDYYEEWEYLENSHLHLGYLLDENLKLRFSFDRIWRAPSFTELYYDSAANKGNTAIDVQKSNNFEWGLDYFPDESFSTSMSCFFKNQSDTIDWVKNVYANPWLANNVGDLDVYGFDFYSQIHFSGKKPLTKFSLGYTYLNLDKESLYNFSKYLFDYNRHKLVSILGLSLKGVSINLVGNFSKPIDRKRYITFDLKAKKDISEFSLELEATNIFDRQYQEMQDIAGSARLLKMSILYAF